MTIRQAEEHLDVRVVVHTHWDREWYRPAAQFQPRLVALIDEVLDGAAGEPFLLDGQAVILEDYLQHRPERAADLSAALRAGAVEAGPWYVLADGLIPSGEGLVRNLLAGRRALQALRAAAPDVLYCPDSFGHPAMLPAIAAGFGLPVVVLWRGYGGRSHPPGDTSRWIAPDESSVVLCHLPPEGYEFGSHLPLDAEAARERWQAIERVLAPRAVTGLALLPAGADHHAPQANLAEAIGELARAAAPHRLARSSLGTFGSLVAARAEGTILPTVAGELRDSYGYTWTLQGTLGARAALKRDYARVERLLVRDAEPWVALARLKDGADRRHVLRAAWRPVLLCQPHDTLCGCSVDEVAGAMASRLAEAVAAGTEARDTALMALVGHDGEAARRRPDAWSAVVVVRNPAARTRSGVAELEVDLVMDDAPVGPASAGIEPRTRRTGPLAIGAPPVPLQELSRERTFAREESARHYPWNRLVERRRVLAWIEDVPALGLCTLPVEERRRRAPTPPAPVSAERSAIMGHGIRIDVTEGGLRFTGADGTVIDDWVMLDAEGERGDLYTHAPVPGTRVRGALVRTRVTARGPLRVELACDFRLAIPERRLTTAAGEALVQPLVRQDVRVTVQLDAGSPFVRLVTRGDNVGTDVRLRLAIRSGIPSAVVVADAAFGPVVREPIVVDGAARAMEIPPATAPLHRHVSVFSGDRGATVLSDGLAEYEVDAEGTVLVTLLRAVGELSRHDLPERPGHAGYPVATPAAQVPGPFEARLAFAAHGPRSDVVTTRIEEMADDFLVPLVGTTWRTAMAPPGRVKGPMLVGEGLALSALKESEDGAWIVLRAVNRLDHAVAGKWSVPGVREAMLGRLDETPVRALDVRDGVIEFRAGPRAVVTILAR